MEPDSTADPIADAEPQPESAARREAMEWLDWLVENGRHDWIRASKMALRARPMPELPCRILAATAYVDAVGHLPYLMLMAGRKQANRYWQYTTLDVGTGLPHPRERALSDITGLVDTLMSIADVPHHYPARRLRAGSRP